MAGLSNYLIHNGICTDDPMASRDNIKGECGNSSVGDSQYSKYENVDPLAFKFCS